MYITSLKSQEEVGLWRRRPLRGRVPETTEALTETSIGRVSRVRRLVPNAGPDLECGWFPLGPRLTAPYTVVTDDDVPPLEVHRCVHGRDALRRRPGPYDVQRRRNPQAQIYSPCTTAGGLNLYGHRDLGVPHTMSHNVESESLGAPDPGVFPVLRREEGWWGEIGYRKPDRVGTVTDRRPRRRTTKVSHLLMSQSRKKHEHKASRTQEQDADSSYSNVTVDFPLVPLLKITHCQESSLP